VIGHAGDSNDLDYLTQLADQGVLLGMDRMVLGHDASCFLDYFGGLTMRSVPPPR